MEPLSADESARGAAYDALLLDLFSEISPADALDATTGALFDASDDAFVDFQADLAAFDALIESPTQGDLVFDIAVSADTAEPSVKHESAVSGECDAAADVTTGRPAVAETVSGGSSATAVVVKKSAPGGNIARKRHREELRALRESVVVLEAELQNLRAKASEASSSPPHNSINSSGGRRHGLDTLSPDQKVPRRWPPSQGQQQQTLKVRFPPQAQPTSETLLARETHARQITELENVHLSKLVNDHQKVAQQFDKALRKETLPTVCSCYIFLERRCSYLS